MMKVWLLMVAFLAANKDVIKDAYPEEQARITHILQDIAAAAQKRDINRVESFHLYTPKFSKFDDDGAGRQDAQAGKQGEREWLTSVKSVTLKFENVKVDVFGPAAVATSTLVYEMDTGKEKLSGRARSTIVFAKDGDTWKIVHEHHSPYKATP